MNLAEKCWLLKSKIRWWTKYYKEKIIKINKMPFYFDFVKKFIEVQNIEKPKKIFKTPLEKYKFIENIYNKKISLSGRSFTSKWI